MWQALFGLRIAALDEVDLARAEENQLRNEAKLMIRQGKVGRFDTFFATDKKRENFKKKLSRLEKMFVAPPKESEGQAFLKELRTARVRRQKLYAERGAERGGER